jgi:putative membrane protein
MKKNNWKLYGIFSALLIIVVVAGFYLTSGGKQQTLDNNQTQLLEASAVAADMDMDFMRDANNDGLFEVKIGKYAQEHASSEDVKTLAQHMVTEHTRINNSLKELAQKKKITLTEQINDKVQKDYDKVAEKTGNDFDKEYVDMMVSKHKDGIDLFEKEWNKGKDEEIKSWANKNLPALKEHLKMAEDTRDKLTAQK